MHAFPARAAILGLILVLSVGAIPLACAQTESVIYSFGDYPDGRGPLGLVRDANGNFYGTTYSGGTSGDGTVFKLTPGGKEKVLFNFVRVPDGANPVAGLVMDASGNLYGTTSLGGANNGCGTVFKINPKGKHKVLYTFACGADGIVYPNGPVTLDAQGNLYGVTWKGGATGNGTVFKVTPGGKEKLLYSFTGGADGGQPAGPLVQDADGNLYGTTGLGGPSLWGTVFKLTPTGKETVIYSFSLGKDGGEPLTGVLRDAKGNFYGTTSSGGGGNCAFGGCGVVFKVTPSGTETVLYSFAGGVDGSLPNGLVRDPASGAFYGTTYGGGAANYGTIFKLSPKGVHKVLYSFTGATDGDGSNPGCALLEDAKGRLYGTTQGGGASTYGTVFKLIP